jgi:hypothetical protein
MKRDHGATRSMTKYTQKETPVVLARITDLIKQAEHEAQERARQIQRATA